MQNNQEKVEQLVKDIDDVLFDDFFLQDDQKTAKKKVIDLLKKAYKIDIDETITKSKEFQALIDSNNFNAPDMGQRISEFMDLKEVKTQLASVEEQQENINNKGLSDISQKVDDNLVDDESQEYTSLSSREDYDLSRNNIQEMAETSKRNEALSYINQKFKEIRKTANKVQISEAKAAILREAFKIRGDDALKLEGVIDSRANQTLTLDNLRQFVNSNAVLINQDNRLGIKLTEKNEGYSPIGGIGKFVGLFIGNGAADDIKNRRVWPGLGKIFVRIIVMPILAPFALLGAISKIPNVPKVSDEKPGEKPGENEQNKKSTVKNVINTVVAGINIVINLVLFPFKPFRFATKAFANAADLTNTTINGQARKILTQKLEKFLTVNPALEEQYKNELVNTYTKINTKRQKLLDNAPWYQRSAIKRQCNMLKKKAEAEVANNMLGLTVENDGTRTTISKLIINDDAVLKNNTKVLSAIRSQIENSTTGMKTYGITDMIGNNILKFDEQKIMDKIKHKKDFIRNTGHNSKEYILDGLFKADTNPLRFTKYDTKAIKDQSIIKMKSIRKEAKQLAKGNYK